MNLFAATDALAGLENYLNLRLCESLQGSVSNLQGEIGQLRHLWRLADTKQALEKLQQLIVRMRFQYQRVETLLDFYLDAINTRANPQIVALLRACDRMAFHSMRALLSPLNRPTPAVLTYIDKGLGASILKAGLRLWDRRTINPAAAIKLARHNLYRPTALVHEAGHQVAHILGWNGELAETLSRELPEPIAPTWASWASEITADTFAFAHTGYAAVAGLHDVVAESPRSVFRFLDGDPHPISYIRVLLGVEMCRQWYGRGPWDGMEKAWRFRYPLSEAASGVRSLMRESLQALPKVATLCLRKPLRAFGSRSLVHFIDPGRVSPQSLLDMEEKLGKSLYLSSHWRETESLRILALTGYRIAVEPTRAVALVRQQADWMRWAGTGIETETETETVSV
ncbi:MAG: hypothetical protein IPM58_02845 [Nitrospira sp.]|nr:hypothetical protein [Nitrospira sp.]